MVGSDHTTINYWPPELRSALIRFCSKYDLDKTYAVFNLATKQLYNDGFLSKEVYDFYIQKYSKTVSSMSNIEQEKHNSLTIDGLKQHQKLDEMTRYFQSILADQWTLHQSPDWRKKTLLVAGQWKDRIPQAKLVLDLGVNQK
jgi:hypothetical protein